MVKQEPAIQPVPPLDEPADRLLKGPAPGAEVPGEVVLHAAQLANALTGTGGRQALRRRAGVKADERDGQMRDGLGDESSSA